MFDDLRALDGMYSGSEGWYNDDKPHSAFDYYNSWVFASHFLYWNALVGSRFPDWAKRFADRLRLYLETSPLFFGANGSHVLYGRSLIYRWAVLTPLVLAYWQKLWPHDEATLHRIVRGNLQFHWNNGAFDSSSGKLRETYSEHGTSGYPGVVHRRRPSLLGDAGVRNVADSPLRCVLECGRRDAPGRASRLSTAAGISRTSGEWCEDFGPGEVDSGPVYAHGSAVSRQVHQIRVLIALPVRHCAKARRHSVGQRAGFA